MIDFWLKVWEYEEWFRAHSNWDESKIRDNETISKQYLN